MVKLSKICVAALGLVIAFPVGGWAADHRVEMLNKGPDGARMVFSPRVVVAEVGDTVTFVPTDKGHNSASMKGGLPSDAEEWKGKINEELKVTITAPGVYMYQCTPHVGMGMIGAIVAGEPANLDNVKSVKYPGKAKAIAEQIIADIGKGPDD